MNYPEPLVLGSGLLLTELDWAEGDGPAALRAKAEAARQAGHCLGRTEGETVLRCVPLLRNPQAAQARCAGPDDWVCDGWEATLSGRLAELTPLTRSLLQGDGHGPGTEVPTLYWVGERGRGLVTAALQRAVNLIGLSLTLRPGREGSAPFRFRAHGEGLMPPCRVALAEEAQGDGTGV